MAEYIEKAALMGLIESEARRWGDDYDWWQCLADIEDFKPAEVRPVVRGRWVYEEPNSANSFKGCYWCDQCHQPVYYKKNFCPDCGADMRGAQDE